MKRLGVTRLCMVGLGALAIAGCSDDPQLSTLTQRVLDLKSQLAQVTTRRDAAEAENATLKGQVTILEQGQSITNAELAAVSNRVNAADQKLAAATSRLNEVAVRAEALAGHVGVDVPDNAEVAALVDAVGEAYARAAERAQTAEMKAAATVAERARLQSRLQAAKHSGDYLSRQVDQLIQTRDALRDGWRAERERSERYAASLESLGSRVQQLEQQRETLGDAKAYLEEQVDFLEARRQALATEAESLTAELDSARAELHNATLEAQALKSTQDSQLRELQRLTEAEDYLYKLFERKSEQLVKTNAELKKQDDAAGKLAAQLADAMAERDALKTESAALTSEKGKLDSALEQRAKEAADSTARAETLGAEIDKLRQTNATLTEQTGELQSQFEETNKALQDLRAQAAERASTNGTDPAALQQALARAEEAELLLAPMTAQRDQLLGMLTEAQARIADLETRLKP